MSEAPRSRRRHDAQASREALLDAATQLFHERGYEQTTIREIGDRAQVDAALIARYFGGKEGLYLATLTREGRPPISTDPLEAFETILARSEERGIGPVLLAMASPTLTDAMREQMRRVLRARLIEPLAGELRERGAGDEAELRAELLLALAMGVSLTRANRTLPQLSRASRSRLLEEIEPLVDALERSPER